jgi:pyruvate dehydrogenase E2 component (dihydrolipoamide acetyltransferase)
MVIKACAMALKTSKGKLSGKKMHYNQSSCYIGVAVAVEDGLVVPVLKFTDAMSLSQIGGSVRDLAGRAKTITNRNGRKYFYCF